MTEEPETPLEEPEIPPEEPETPPEEPVTPPEEPETLPEEPEIQYFLGMRLALVMNQELSIKGASWSPYWSLYLVRYSYC
jgi:hypothetical protein